MGGAKDSRLRAVQCLHNVRNLRAARVRTPAGEPTGYHAPDFVVEPDASAATYLWAAETLTGGSIDLKGLVWTAAGGYSLVLEPKANLDVIAGFRYFGLDTTVNTNIVFSRSAEKDVNIWAGIVGARGRANFGDSKWFANGYVDVGSGSSAFTWQGVAGVGYTFDWGDVILDYRYLYYSQSGRKPIEDMKMGGPALGVNFRF